eukprot:757734-Hanusia_phi.AAC.5
MPKSPPGQLSAAADVAQALSAAIVKHLQVLDKLRRMGEVEVDPEDALPLFESQGQISEFTLFNNFDKTPLLLATFTKR